MPGLLASLGAGGDRKFAQKELASLGWETTQAAAQTSSAEGLSLSCHQGHWGKS